MHNSANIIIVAIAKKYIDFKKIVVIDKAMIMIIIQIVTTRILIGITVKTFPLTIVRGFSSCARARSSILLNPSN